MSVPKPVPPYEGRLNSVLDAYRDSPEVLLALRDALRTARLLGPWREFFDPDSGVWWARGPTLEEGLHFETWVAGRDFHEDAEPSEEPPYEWLTMTMTPGDIGRHYAANPWEARAASDAHSRANGWLLVDALIPLPLMFERYSADHLGLKHSTWETDEGKKRGVPEGSPNEWRSLLAAMRSGDEFAEKRLAWDPVAREVSSPRNTNPGCGYVFDDPVAGADQLKNLLSECLTGAS